MASKDPRASAVRFYEDGSMWPQVGKKGMPHLPDPAYNRTPAKPKKPRKK